MNHSDHVPIKKVLSILIPPSIFLLFFVGYALKQKTNISLEQIVLILLIFAVMSFLLIYFFYKKSLNKTPETVRAENAALNDYMSIRQGRFNNQQSNLGKWFIGATITGILFPLMVKITVYFVDFIRPDFIILILGYLIIFIFIIGIVVTNRKK